MAKKKSTPSAETADAQGLDRSPGRILEAYLAELHAIRVSGAGVEETSYYPALCNLFNAVGKTLKPTKVRCIIHTKNQGAGIPDGGLFTADQFLRQSDGTLKAGQLPARGAIEAKGTKPNVNTIAASSQVKEYLKTYGIVLVTNLREFLIVERGGNGHPVARESFALAENEQDFWKRAAAHPHVTAQEKGQQFVEFVMRACLHAAPLTKPKDVAWFLASYARDALLRVERQKELPALQSVRSALEEALGMTFTEEKGEHFFRSTLVQTLFYGVFSAWVRWHKDTPNPQARFDWRTAEWTLHVPFIRTLYEEVAKSSRLGPLGLVEVLDWAAAVLNRVDRGEFFSDFEDHHAVQYFYEPFLEAYDPELRKELGVWYTPPEIVRYQVARVDRVLREELELADGLADPNVIVLDPCCGTGAYLVEVLHSIAATLRDKGGDALVASDLKQAAMTRVCGFEIMPAPFVVSHLQLGLMLQAQGAPLSHKEGERAGVYLTNALTGWEPPKGAKQKVMSWVELQEERDAAEHVKRDKKILVVLGNPPYNGFAGMAVDEERDLSTAYRATKKAPAPQGQGLNDLYVRFFRMAERRIVEMNEPGRGVVCFISNYSWLDGLSFTGMRERYLEEFDRIWIDCLNGDKYKTGKLTPDGAPDPSVFSTEFNREGIQVGTAVALLVRKEQHESTPGVQFRHFWGKDKRAEIAAASGLDEQKGYDGVEPAMEMGLPFIPATTSADYFSWPLLPQLFPVSFPGIQPSRDDVVVDIERDRLIERMERYFDTGVTHEEMQRLSPRAMEKTKRFDPIPAREYLQKRGLLKSNFVRFAYRPFDLRWLYWEPETKLLDEKREEYFAHVRAGNVWLAAAQRHRKDFDSPFASARHCSRHVDERGANLFPLYLSPDTRTLLEPTGRNPNISQGVAAYLATTKVSESEPFYHALSVLHAPVYRSENAGALRQDWPRIPLPAHSRTLRASAALGEQIAALLNSEADVAGVTKGKISPLLKTVGLISRAGGGQLDAAGSDLAVTAGWGHAGGRGETMPAKGKLAERAYDEAEAKAIDAHARQQLGNETFDIYLNDTAFWRNVPKAVWEYHIGGYQVMKKWLSYRELELLGRPLKPEEAREVTNMARRIAAILLLQPKLDENYREVIRATYDWPVGPAS